MLRHLQQSQLRRSLALTAKKLSSTSRPARLISNKKCNYSIDEVTIPSPSGNLAGQLWTAEESSHAKTLPPPIICTHGTLDNAGSFKGLLPLVIRPNMKVLCIDLPGHGLSSHLKTGHYDPSLDGSKAILQAVKYLKSPKIILMGHSHGAGSSFLFSGIYPELIDRLIAIEFHPLTTPDPVLYAKFHIESQLRIDEKLARDDPPPSFTYEEILEKIYQGRSKTTSWQACKILLERGATKLPDGKYAFTYDLRATLPPPGRFTMDQLEMFGAAIKCPITVVRAQPGDYGRFAEGLKPNIGDSEELVTRMKKHNDNVQLHFVPGSHFVHMNEPDLIAPLISAALKPLS